MTERLWAVVYLVAVSIAVVTAWYENWKFCAAAWSVAALMALNRPGAC